MKNTPRRTVLSRALLLATAVLLLWPLAGMGQAQQPLPPHDGQQLAFGQAQSGFISVAAEVDTYTFVANAGDVILIGVSRSSGDLWPRVRLYQPGGVLLQDEDDPTHVEISQALPVGGTYSVHVSDGFDGTYTGGYVLYLQRLNAPGNATPLSFGQTSIGFVSQPAEMDTFIFEAQANDTVLVAISNASGDLWPQIRLYDPHGNLVGTNGDPDHAEITLVVAQRWVTYLPLVVRNHGGAAVAGEGTRGVLVHANLPGTYTILASDDLNGTLTGSYGLHVQRLNNPGDAIDLAFGQTWLANINQAAEMDAYTFAGTAGDVVLVAASNATGDLWPLVRVYDPLGNMVGTAADPDHAEVQTILASPGTYTVLISDDLNGALTGAYGVHVQRLDNPGGATAIAFGQTLAGSINQASEIDAYTFAANAGDAVLVGISKSSGDVWPQIRLFDPDGKLAGIAHDPTHAEIQVVLASSGTYTVLVDDYLSGSLTGGYALHAQRLNDPGNATAITYGDLVAATINMAAEMDAYTFEGAAGDSILIDMARTSGTLWPQIRLFGPDGALAGTAGGATLAELYATLSTSGTYTVLAADDLNGTLTGEYDLQLQETTQ